MWEDLIKMEKEWENIALFDDYKASLSELDENEKSIAKMKLNYFIRCVKDATIKIFQIWTQDLLFLSIFSNQSTARCIVQMIMGHAVTDTPECFCKYHNRIINVSKFEEFVEANYNKNTIMEIRALPVIVNNYPAVAMISRGGNVWEASASPILNNFKKITLLNSRPSLRIINS